MKLFLIYIVLNILYVCLTTAFSLVVQRCGKWTSALLSAITYGLYAVVLVYAVCDLPLWLKVLTIFCINFISVAFVKYIQEKMTKDKLWRIDVRMPKCLSSRLTKDFVVPFEITAKLSDEFDIVSFYCYTQEQTTIVKEQIIKNYELKYCAIEGKEL